MPCLINSFRLLLFMYHDLPATLILLFRPHSKSCKIVRLCSYSQLWAPDLQDTTLQNVINESKECLPASSTGRSAQSISSSGHHTLVIGGVNFARCLPHPSLCTPHKVSSANRSPLSPTCPQHPAPSAPVLAPCSSTSTLQCMHS